MTAKHYPATSLPWTHKDQHGGNMPQMEHPTRVQFGREGFDTGSHVGEVYVWKRDTAKAAQDAAYIVHAANAYPQMVETLKDFILDHRNGLGPDITRLEALLRYIGEAE